MNAVDVSADSLRTQEQSRREISSSLDFGQRAEPVCQPAHSVEDKRSNFRQSWAVLRGLAPYSRRHWRWFALGAIAAVGVVAARLALPWPLRTVADLARGAADSNWILTLAPSGLDPVLAMGGIFFALIFALGLSDLLERLYFARFSIATVRGLRSEAIAAVVGTRAEERSSQSGDLVSRLIGDTGRIKSGMQGFLVHVATNGLVFVGMTVILFTMHVRLGLIFALAGIATALVTAWAAARIFRNTISHRAREGELADRIQDALQSDSDDDTAMAEIDDASNGDEARQTKFQGIATWTTHAIYGAAVLAALWAGSAAVEAGELALGDLVVFMMYALMIRGPIVRLARQGSKTGKIFGAGYRLVQLFDTTKGAAK